MKKFLALSILPVLIVVVILETALRLVGYVSPLMDPYASFVEHRPLFHKRGDAFVTAPERTAFFQSASFAAEKPGKSIRFFVFGGSAVYGYKLDSPASQNYCALLGGKLAAQRSGAMVEAVNCGGICYASYRLVGLVRECLDYSPDFVVVATGHNEFLEPRHYKKLIAGDPKRSVLLRMSRTAQLIQHTCARPASGREQAAPTMAALAPDAIDERYVVRDEDEYEQTRLHFEHNLVKIAHMCRDRGVPVALCTLPSNLRDWPPFHTAIGPAMPRKLLSSELAKITELYGAEDHERALMLARDVTKLHPRAAVFHFMAGKCLDRLGKTDEARAAYELARDRDAFPHRTLSSFNKTIRRVAKGEGPLLFDAEKLFAEKSADGIPGNDLFLDQCHPNEKGHRLLAEGLLETITAAGLVEAR